MLIRKEKVSITVPFEKNSRITRLVLLGGLEET